MLCLASQLWWKPDARLLGVGELLYEQGQVLGCSKLKKGLSWQALALFQNEATASGVAPEHNFGLKQAELVLTLSNLMGIEC